MRLLTLPAGRHATVEVPATSANLGPGFDCFGLALDWRDTVVFETRSDPEVVVEIEGEGQGRLPVDASNLIVRSLQAGLDQLGARFDGLRVRVRNTIPQGRGLGSSSAAIVAGLAAAHALARPGAAFDPAHWLPIANRIEGHPDNVAAALFGGLVLAYESVADGRVTAVTAMAHPQVAGLVLVPNQALTTEVARSVLPASVPHADAAANAGRAALLLHALTTAPDLLFEASADWLHQAYRGPSMPESYALVTGLRARGVAAVVSGAGPTVLVLGRRPSLDQAERAAGELAPGEFRAVPVRVGEGVRILPANPAAS